MGRNRLVLCWIWLVSCFAGGCGAEITIPVQLHGDTSWQFRAEQMTMVQEEANPHGLLLAFEEGHYQIWLESIRMAPVRDQWTHRGRAMDLAVRLRDQTGNTLAQLVEGEAPATWQQFAMLPGKRTLQVIQTTLQQQWQGDAQFADDVALMGKVLQYAIGAHDVAAERNGGLALLGPEERARSNALLATPSNSEFQQWIWLYSKKMLGTDFDHTATYAILFVRDKETMDPWYPYVPSIMPNFGSAPYAEKMEQYDFCYDTPITFKHYHIGRRCVGSYLLNHLCNDNTALQINDAYGVTKSNRCQGTKRLRRPSCEVQW